MFTISTIHFLILDCSCRGRPPIDLLCLELHPSQPFKVQIAVQVECGVVPILLSHRLGNLSKPLADHVDEMAQRSGEEEEKQSQRKANELSTYFLPVGNLFGLRSPSFNAPKTSSIGAVE